jgi:hypothetical protein
MQLNSFYLSLMTEKNKLALFAGKFFQGSIFAGKARSLSIEIGTVRYSSLIDSALTSNYEHAS